jgi:hypothetical protein
MTNKESFLEYCTKVQGFTKAESRIIYKVYTENKIIKHSKHCVAWTVSHGAFLDKNVMQNALI